MKRLISEKRKMKSTRKSPHPIRKQLKSGIEKVLHLPQFYLVLVVVL